jgi:hypothetical protein
MSCQRETGNVHNGHRVSEANKSKQHISTLRSQTSDAEVGAPRNTDKLVKARVNQ